MANQVHIRGVRPGDAQQLAYIQTESWKAAFQDIVPADILSKCTEMGPAAAMYNRLLAENVGHGYLLELDGKPHAMAWWDDTREKDMPGFAELICIHSLPDNWHRGYGKQLMAQVLEDVQRAGYGKIMLWVFEQNPPAIRFYESLGFTASGRTQPALGAVEAMYSKEF